MTRSKDETGSIAMFLMIAVMGLTIGTLLVPMIITQTRTTRLDTTRVHAVDAAQAGIEVMAGQIRAAGANGVGVNTELPCDPITGVVNGSGPASYSVKVDYYMADPVGTPTPAKMRCAQGYGTYDPVTDSSTPRFARITSTGKDGPAFNGGTRGRTLETTYVFRTTNTNIVGGRVRVYPASSTVPALCMDAGRATPSAGTIITMQVCANPSTQQQIFAYHTDLTLQLLSSVTGTYPNGLCLDTAAPPTSGNRLFLGQCRPIGSPTYTQQWSFNDGGHYEAALPDSRTDGDLSGLCMNLSNQTPGVIVTMAACSGGPSDPEQAWIPSPALGPGAAEAPQLINFYEFGRCLDVTNRRVTSDHLIAFPCKQNPNPAAVLWNQKWTTPGIAAGGASATGPIYVTYNGTNYCLASPGASGAYVVVTACSGSIAERWRVYNGSSALPYSTKYTILDSGGRCLGLTDPYPAETWSAIDVEPCTGASEHKWNALPNLSTSALQDFEEIATP